MSERAEARAKQIKVNVAKWLKDAQLVSADPHTFSYLPKVHLPKAPLTSTSVEAQTFPIEKTQSSRTTHVRSGT